MIKGYHPEIDHEAANLPLQILFICSASPTERSELAQEVMGIHGVVDLRELMTGRRNLHIDVVGTSREDVTHITNAIHDLGLQIDSSELLQQRLHQPFDHFQFADPSDSNINN